MAKQGLIKIKNVAVPPAPPPEGSSLTPSVFVPDTGSFWATRHNDGNVV